MKRKNVFDDNINEVIKSVEEEDFLKNLDDYQINLVDVFERPAINYNVMPFDISAHGFVKTETDGGYSAAVTFKYENEKNTSLYNLFYAMIYFFNKVRNTKVNDEVHGIRFAIFHGDQPDFRNFTAKQLKRLLKADNEEKISDLINNIFEEDNEENNDTPDEEDGSDGKMRANMNMMFNPQMFVIYVPRIKNDKYDIRGGRFVEYKEVKNRKLNEILLFDRYICIEKPSEFDCLIDCFKIYSKDKTQNKTIREKLGFPPGMLSIGHIPALEKMYKVNIRCIIPNGEELYSSVDKRLKTFKKDEKEIQYYDKPCFTILLHNEHFYYINKELKDDIYNLKNNNDLPRRYIGLDFETVWDLNGRLLPYGFYVNISDDSGKIIDFAFAAGFGCLSTLKNFLLKWDDKEYKNVIVGYNSARFDNFILLEAITGWGWMDRSSIFFVKSSILQLRFKSYCVFDIVRYTGCPLKEALDGFKCNLQKETFDHNEVQNIYMEGKLNDWLKTNFKKLLSYNRIDVMSMMELFFKCKSSFELVSEKLLAYKLPMEDYMTVSSYAYSIFEIIEEPNCNIFEKKDFIRSAMFGGRSQVNRRGYFGSDTAKKFRSLDVKSLYPFVMKNCEFPDGDYTETESYVEGKLGIYRVTILEQPECNIIPLRTKDAPLNWKYKGVIECNLSSIDIQTLLRHKSKIIIHEGIYWENSRKIFERFITEPEKIKTEQDLLAAAGSIEYNAALRNCMKLFMNALSGKVGQNLFDDVTKLITSRNEYYAFLEKYDLKAVYVNRGALIVKGKLKQKKESGNIKPWYLSVFIYSYSRTHMYDSVLSKVNWFCTDTDSCHVDEENFNKLVDEGAGFGKFHMGGKFGDFEDELSGMNFQRAYFIRPKCYGYFDGRKANKKGEIEIVRKLRFKGISARDRLYITGNNYRETVEKFEKMSVAEKYEIFNTLPEIYNEQLYINLLASTSMIVISSRIKKSLTGLQQVYLLKHVSREVANF